MRSLEELLDTIMEATQDDRLHWSEKREQVYSTKLSGRNVTIWYWTDPDSETKGVTIRLEDQGGKTLDVVQADQYSTNFPKLAELFNAARRSALNVTQVISELEAELKTLKPSK